MQLNSRRDRGSRNCWVTNARTWSLDLASTFGGVLNLSPTAASIRGTASETCLPYGPEASAFFSLQANAAPSASTATAALRVARWRLAAPEDDGQERFNRMSTGGQRPIELVYIESSESPQSKAIIAAGARKTPKGTCGGSNSALACRARSQENG